MEEAAEETHWHERAGVAETTEGEEVSGEERPRQAAIDHLVKPATEHGAAVTVRVVRWPLLAGGCSGHSLWCAIGCRPVQRR